MTLVFPLVREELTGRVQNVTTMRSYTVNVIANPRESALLERAGLRFHELLEAVARQLLVLDVVRFVLVWKKIRRRELIDQIWWRSETRKAVGYTLSAN